MNGEIWWVIIHAPSGVYLWEVGDAEAPGLEARVDEIRATLGVPPFGSEEAAAWDVQMAPGEPHPSLLARAVEVHRLEPPDTGEGAP